MKQHIWNGKNGTLYITYCEDNGTPIFSTYYETETQRQQAIKKFNKGRF